MTSLFTWPRIRWMVARVVDCRRHCPRHGQRCRFHDSPWPTPDLRVLDSDGVYAVPATLNTTPSAPANATAHRHWQPARLLKCWQVLDAQLWPVKLQRLGALQTAAAHQDAPPPNNTGADWNGTRVRERMEVSRLQQELTACRDLIVTWNANVNVWIMAVEEGDSALQWEARQDLVQLAERVEQFAFQFMMRSPEDGMSCFVELHAGAGGTEATDWTRLLASMYRSWARRHDMKVAVMDEQRGDEAGFKTITFEIRGPFAYGWFRHEMGIHRLVRVSPFDANSRRHTSFASVTVCPFGDASTGPTTAASKPAMPAANDLVVETLRSGGAGGQHVNKTESAIRILHKPTGLVVKCSQERSQHQNRALAMKMLQARLWMIDLEEKNQSRTEFRNSLAKNEWGSQIRSYVLTPYQMVKETRTGVSTANVTDVLDGGEALDEFMMANLLRNAQLTRTQVNRPMETQ